MVGFFNLERLRLLTVRGFGDRISWCGPVDVGQRSSIEPGLAERRDSGVLAKALKGRSEQVRKM
jgi:hypothetical protein